MVVKFPGFPAIRVAGPAIKGIDAVQKPEEKAECTHHGMHFESVTTWALDGFGRTRNYQNGVLVGSLNCYPPGAHEWEREKFMEYALALTEEEISYIRQGIDLDELYD